MIKVFISQPMKNRTNEEIEKTREEIIKQVKERFGEVEIIDSFFKDAPVNSKPLWFLAKSLELMSKADLVVFAPGWNCARGCIIEHECAKGYHYPILEIEL